MAPPEMDLQEKEGIFSQQDGICADKDSFGNEIVPKIRKPYTISKQRERWTEEEHNKFLEALQLYGRAWRRIEEHIGTKTTVQIRSHAQKFFSKVTKEPTNNGENIEIPPPRPKRKPSHPYPRKLGNQPKLDITKLNNKSENSFPQISQVIEKRTSSPTSVLSSENLDSNSKSPIESEESGNQSPTAMSADENVCNNAEIPIMEEEQAPSIKLFGKTVVLTESNKSNSNESENVNIVSIEKPKNDNSDQVQLQNGINPFLYYLPFTESSMNNAAMVAWSVYGNMPYPFINPYQIMGNFEPQQENEKEGSWTGSSEIIDENSSDGNTREKGGKDEKPMRGFVPYKRCKMEANLEKDGESKEQDIKLCL
ncbi:hypothetical protein LUZ60_014582 [Juncus effusus]|nr:hypothetical protein LUZ60_014582 [Juncus effusus]